MEITRHQPAVVAVAEVATQIMGLCDEGQMVELEQVIKVLTEELAALQDRLVIRRQALQVDNHHHQPSKHKTFV